MTTGVQEIHDQGNLTQFLTGGHPEAADANAGAEGGVPPVETTTPPGAAPAAGTATPGGAMDAGEKSEPFHKHPRFQELIRKNREMERRIAELSARPSSPPAGSETGQIVESLAQKYGMDPEQARAVLGLANELYQGYQATQEQTSKKARLDGYYDSAAERYEDFAEYEADMEELLGEMQPAARRAIAEDAHGLDLLYARAKFARQVSEAETRSTKQKAGAGAAAGGGEPGRKSMETMTNEELFAAMKAGKFR